MQIDKRKKQLSEAQKRYRERKKEEQKDYVGFTYRIKREWRRSIVEFIKSLK